jgi:hypothetical protein
VRLWPTGVEGRAVQASLAAAEVMRHQTKDAVSKQLAERLAVEVVKLFCDHRESQFRDR